MLTIRPTGNRVLVHTIRTIDSSLDVVTHSRPLSGTVEAVGPKIKSIKPGDTVHFGPRAGVPIQAQDGPPRRVLLETEILAFERPA